MLELNKEEFLKTEFGSTLKECITAWDHWLAKLRQFYGILYYFNRSNEYFGVSTEDETDWLFKVEREV